MAPHGEGPGGGGKRGTAKVELVANVLYTSAGANSSSRGGALQNETYANVAEGEQAAQNNTYDAWGQGQGYTAGVGGQGPASHTTVVNATYAPADPNNRGGAVASQPGKHDASKKNASDAEYTTVAVPQSGAGGPEYTQPDTLQPGEYERLKQLDLDTREYAELADVSTSTNATYADVGTGGDRGGAVANATYAAAGDGDDGGGGGVGNAGDFC